MIRKIYNSNYPVYRTAKDVNRLANEALKIFNEKKSLDNPINRDDAVEWLIEEVERLKYDRDALNEDELYHNVLNYPKLCPEEKLLDYQKEKMEALPIKVDLKNELLAIEIKGLLQKNDYSNSHLVHNLANEIETSLKFYENETGKRACELFASPQYSLYVIRYIKKNRTSSSVCDPSNVELSHIINTVTRLLGLSDSYQGMVNYSVRYEYIDSSERLMRKHGQECTVLLFGNEEKIELYLGGFEIN